MLRELTLFGEIDKVKISIERLKTFDPSINDPKNIYKLPFSGGKDSLCCYMLAMLAGVKFIPIKAPTPDPPELQQYVRHNFKEAKTLEDAVMEPPYKERKIYYAPCKKVSSRTKRKKYIGRPKTMWNLIRSRKFPPTRMVRYCCSDLKENVGEIGDTLILGVRREESDTRSDRGIVSYWEGKTCINPIVDWSEEEVWEFIKVVSKQLGLNFEYCCLYDEGFRRLGCIGCPLSSNQDKEFERWPNFKKAYINCFNEMLENWNDDEKKEWQTGEDVFNWWISKCKKEKEIEGQTDMCKMM